MIAPDDEIPDLPSIFANKTCYFQDLKSHLESHGSDYEKLMKTGQPLLDKCSSNTDPVSKTLNKTKNNWESLDAKLNKATNKIDDMKKALDALEENIKPVEEICCAVETDMAQQPIFGLDVEAGDLEAEKLEVLL